MYKRRAKRGNQGVTDDLNALVEVRESEESLLSN